MSGVTNQVLADRAGLREAFKGAVEAPQDHHRISVPVPHPAWQGALKGEYEGEVLDDKGERRTVKMPFEWLTKDIMVMRNVLDHYEGGCEKAIEVAESIERWRRTDVMTADDEPRIVYNEESRNNTALSVWRDVDPRLASLEYALMVVSQAGAYTYGIGNTFIDIHHDMGYLLNRYREGEYFKAHIDTVRTDAYLALRRLSMVIFLNEVEEGGELEFIRDGIKLKPEPGLAVLFPAGITHPHEAHEVKRGTKYAVVTWYV